MTEDKPILVFDSSEMDNFQMCKRRWHLIHHLNLQPITSVYALDRGSLLHLILAHYYKLKLKGIDEQTCIEESIEEGRKSSLAIEGLNPQDCAEVYFQFREYCRYYSEVGDNIYPMEGGIERPFIKQIYEDDNLIIALQGIIDYLGKYVGSDNLLVMDHKGISQRQEYSILRNQFKNYAIAAGVDTVVVNKIGFQKTLTPAERFSRQIITYSQDQLDEQKEIIIADGKMMLLHMKNEFFPPNFTACDYMSGCGFKNEFCSARPDARPYKVGTHFLIGKKWDVGEKLDKERK
ncbi:MAG: PD-(D/E)XK nuclease family protein [Candidatus Paceibacterota bacterium]